MKAVTSILPYVFLVILFNFLFFVVLDYEQVPTAWTCFVFFHVSICLCILPKLLKPWQEGMKILESTLTSTCLSYLLIECLTCVFFILICSDSKSWAMAVQAIELTVFLSVFFLEYHYNLVTEEGYTENTQRTIYVTRWINQVSLAFEKSTVEDNRYLLRRLLLRLQSVPSASNLSVKSIDIEINQMLSNIIEKSDNNSSLSEDEVEGCIIKLNERAAMINSFRSNR